MAKTATKTERATSVRPPIVVVMGHIDHGKTTLLDTVRKTNVAGKEAGGITQHIGAYEIDHDGKKITFIDTPGHEAFKKMRERGAKVADIAVLVVAADDGVKPQTLEALEAIRAAKIPFIIALNKIDTSGANPDSVKKQLSEHEVFIEEWGGKVPLVQVSAKQGTNISDLIDMILLVAELEQVSVETDTHAKGVVIESHRDPRRGNTATLLLRSGRLTGGDFVAAGDAMTRVRILENYLGKSIPEAGPSQPVRVVGFDKVPPVGAEFLVTTVKREAEAYVESAVRSHLRGVVVGTSAHDDITIIPLYIKADAEGSREVLEETVQKLSFGSSQLKLVGSAVGDITEGDVKTVATDRGEIDAMILGFNVKVSPDAEFAAERFGVRIGIFSIIYEAMKWVEDTTKDITPKKRVRKDQGVLEILRIFNEEKGSLVIGGRVTEGSIGVGEKFEAQHRGRTIGKGTIKSLQKEKSPVDRVDVGSLCGLSISFVRDLEKGDELKVYTEEEIS